MLEPRLALAEQRRTRFCGFPRYLSNRLDSCFAVWWRHHLIELAELPRRSVMTVVIGTSAALVMPSGADGGVLSSAQCYGPTVEGIRHK